MNDCTPESPQNNLVYATDKNVSIYNTFVLYRHRQIMLCNFTFPSTMGPRYFRSWFREHKAQKLDKDYYCEPMDVGLGSNTNRHDWHFSCPHLATWTMAKYLQMGQDRFLPSRDATGRAEGGGWSCVAAPGTRVERTANWGGGGELTF